MQFNNAIIAPLIIAPLRYHFATYTKASNIYWDEDEKKRTIDIGESFDFNKVALQEKPRIIVARGSYGITKTGLTDNLAQQARPYRDTGGRKDYINMLIYNGSASLLVEARNKGTCELVADMASHFIAWTRPLLCDSQGWKEFGLPMTVSDCNMQPDEDPAIVKFQIQIMFPWLREEQWRYQDDGVELKKVLATITPAVG